MSNDVRITIDELKKRMKAEDDFAFIDARNPQAWAQSDVMLPEAVRVPFDDFDKHLYEIPTTKQIVTYCS